MDLQTYVTSQLVDALGLSPGDANVWIVEPNQLLGGDSPAERLEAGDLRAAVGLIEGLADGVLA